MMPRYASLVAPLFALSFAACESGTAPPVPIASAAPAVAESASKVATAPAATAKPSASAVGADPGTFAIKTADQMKPPADGIPAPADVASAPADAAKTPSGLATKVLTPGTGKDHPAPEDTVKVNYTGWTTDGKMFDSSIPRGEPTSFPVNRVIPGWTEGLQLMVVGEKRRFWIPAKLAYGEKPRMGAPAGDLVFDVELLDVTPPPKPPAVPEDVKLAPKSAKKTASGLAYRVLTEGKGAQHPKPTDTVTVHYSGWTTDGKLFDSSVMRGESASFRLDQVIPGWTEGLGLMTVGQKTRFWIPGKLAYGDKPKRPGQPAGTLVFDVELLSIK